jgi:hypothetical protein
MFKAADAQIFIALQTSSDYQVEDVADRMMNVHRRWWESRLRFRERCVSFVLRRNAEYLGTVT